MAFAAGASRGDNNASDMATRGGFDTRHPDDIDYSPILSDKNIFEEERTGKGLDSGRPSFSLPDRAIFAITRWYDSTVTEKRVTML